MARTSSCTPSLLPDLVPREAAARSAAATSAPSKMARPSVKALNAHAAAVSWSPPADVATHRGFRLSSRAALSGATCIGGFQLRYRETYGNQLIREMTDVGESWPPDAQRAVLRWLKGGHTYIFEVAAFNSFGIGDWSDGSEPFMMPRRAGEEDEHPDSVYETREIRSTVGLSPHPDSIELAWRRPCHRGSEILNYELLCSRDPLFAPGSTRKLLVPDTKMADQKISVVVPDLEPNVTYYFKHRAANRVGASPWSPSTGGISTLARPPERPKPPVRLDDDGDRGSTTEVGIRWEAPVSYDIPVQRYYVRYSRHSDMMHSTEIPAADDADVHVLHSASGPRTPRSARGTLPSISVNPMADARLPPRRGAQSARRPCPPPPASIGPATWLKVRGLLPATDYYFQVKAVNQIGESDWSAPSVPMRTAITAPGRPGQVLLVSAGTPEEGLRIRWAVPENNGAPVVRYDLRVSRVAMVTHAVVRPSVHVTEVEGNGEMPLSVETIVTQDIYPNGTEHVFQVCAWNAAGCGEWSRQSAPMQAAPEIPPAPDAPNRFIQLPRTIVVHWEAPLVLGAPITRYCLRYAHRAEMVKSVEVAGLYNAETKFAVTGLMPNQSYFFQVAAVNCAGRSAWSPVSRGVQVLQDAPNKMSAPYLLASTQKELHVAFAAPSDYGTHDGEMISSYTMQYADEVEKFATKEGVIILHDVKPSGTVVPDLRPGQTYHFQVFAYNQFGEGEPSDVRSFSTAPAEPGPPAPPEFAERAAGSITLALHPERCDWNGAPVTHCALRSEDVRTGRMWDTPLMDLQPAPGDVELLYGVCGLKAGMSYRFRLKAVNKIGHSEWSEPSKDLQALPGAPNSIGEHISVHDIGAHQFTVTWDVPFDCGSEITGYTVRHLSLKGMVEGWTTSTEHICGDCVAGTVSKVSVSAHNRVGEGPTSDELEVQLLAGLPHAPRHLACREPNIQSLHLSWWAPHDGGSRLTGAVVRFTGITKDGRPEEARHSGEVVLHSFKHQIDVVHLWPDTEYEFQVAARNDVGQGPFCPPCAPKRTLAPLPPEAPGKPRLVWADIRRICATWDLFYNGGTPVLDQAVWISMDPAQPELGRRQEIFSPPAEIVKVATIKGHNKPRMKKPKPRPPEDNPPKGSMRPLPRKLANPSDSEPAIHVTASPYGAVGKVALGADEWRVDEGAGGPTASLLKEGTYEITGLLPGTRYYLSVALRNSTGLGARSVVSEPMETKCGPPLDDDLQVELHLKTWDSLTLAIKPPDCQGSALIRYEVFCSVSEESREPTALEFPSEAIDDLARPRLLIGNLLPAHRYFLRIRATNSIGSCRWVPADYTTDPTVPARVPTPEPEPQTSTENSLRFRWSPPDDHGSTILRYEIKSASAPLEAGLFSDEDVLSRPSNVLCADAGASVPPPPRFTVEGLNSGEAVALAVRAGNALGWGPWSEVAQRDSWKGKNSNDFCTQASPPSVPQAPFFEETSIKERSGDLCFELGQARGAMYTVYRYRLYKSETARDWHEVKGLPGDNGESPFRESDRAVGPEEQQKVLSGILLMKHALEDLEPGTIYAARVQVANAKGSSPWSDLGKPTRTLPGKPIMNRDLVSDAQSCSSIKLKILPPFHNGAPLLGYDIRWNEVSEELPIDKWTAIPENVLMQNWWQHDYIREAKSYVVADLDSGRPYFFTYRVRNRMGYSEWSERSRFMTLPSPPDQIHTLACEAIYPRGLKLRWEAPGSMGIPITRYTFAASMRRTILTWGRLVQELRMNTMDSDRLFSVSRHMPEETWETFGETAQGDLECDEVLVAQNTPDCLEYEMLRLAKARPYFCMVRAENSAGKGHWSWILGPLVTTCTEPDQANAFEIEEITHHHCRVSFLMPYDNGAPILDASAKITRLEGPLADHEADSESGSCHQHIAAREVVFEPRGELLHPEKASKNEKDIIERSRTVGSLTPTSVRFMLTLDNLLAGTTYSVAWTCRNAEGRAPTSLAAIFITEANLPDAPDAIMLAQEI